MRGVSSPGCVLNQWRGGGVSWYIRAPAPPCHHLFCLINTRVSHSTVNTSQALFPGSAQTEDTAWDIVTSKGTDYWLFSVNLATLFRARKDFPLFSLEVERALIDLEVIKMSWLRASVNFSWEDKRGSWWGPLDVWEERLVCWTDWYC